MTNIQLTNTEKAILMGTLLADGTMTKRGNSYRVRISHSIKHKSYVEWKRNKLENICRTTQEPTERTDRKGYKTLEFYTTSGEYLKEIYHLFYKQQPDNSYKKMITPELLNNLPKDPMVLAVFYMDDGSTRDDCYAGKLATQGFSLLENELLRDYLKQEWNIKCEVVKHTEISGQYYLSIPARSFGDFIALIESIVREVPEMCYKLNDQRKPRND